MCILLVGVSRVRDCCFVVLLCSRVLVFCGAGLLKHCVLPVSMFALAASVIVESALAAM
jgi:hypothetical protein